MSEKLFSNMVIPLYNPKNYLAIFSTLNKLEKGDDIFVKYDGITYNYKIEDKFEVRPTDVQILDQYDNETSLSLVTCTPPGHPAKPKRLVVKAGIVSNLSLK